MIYQAKPSVLYVLVEFSQSLYRNPVRSNAYVKYVLRIFVTTSSIDLSQS
jgi:hypothetical protein